MRKVTILAIAMCISLGAFAQFKRGKQFKQGRALLGGSVSFQTHKNKSKAVGASTSDDGTVINFSLAPQIGYFVIDYLALGASVDLSLEKETGDNKYEATSSSIQFQPFVRCYLQSGVFFQGQVGIGSQRDRTLQSITSTETTGRVTSWALSGGYALFLNKNVAIEPIIGYGSSTVKDVRFESKAFDSGLFIRVGVQVYLGR